ncbi:MAG: carboxypeptidase-like regulatory domain-containing protein [Planctomycetota bacterium]
MSHLSRPSHFMLLFLASAAFAFVYCGERIVPGETDEGTRTRQAEMARRMRPRGEIIHRGRSEVQFPTEGSRPERAELEKPVARAPSTLWTVLGRVLKEEARNKILPLSFGIDLELVPLGEGPHAARGLRRSRSEGDGSFRVEDIFPGDYRLRALLDPEEAGVLPVAVDLNLPEVPREALLADQGSEVGTQIRRQELTLPLPRLMVGRLETKTKSGLKGLRISVTETGCYRGRTVSDDQGQFRIPGVGKGPYEFEIQDSDGKNITWVMGVRTEEKDQIQVSLLLP